MQGVDATVNKIKPSFFSLVPIADGEQEHSERAVENTGEDREPWWGSFFCAVNAADYALAIFTFLLFVSTGALWYVTWRTLAHSQESSERQLRAYVGVSAGEIDFTNSPPRAEITVMNTGNTPAHALVHTARVRLFNHPLTESTLQLFPAIKGAGKTVLWPGCHMIIGRAADEGISNADFGYLREGKRVLVVYGRIDYIDAFDKPQHSEFRLITGGDVGLVVRANQRGTLVNADDGNDAT